MAADPLLPRADRVARLRPARRPAGSGWKRSSRGVPISASRWASSCEDDASARRASAATSVPATAAGDWDQASGVITIPASAVKRMLAVSPRGDMSTIASTWPLAG